MDPDANWAEQEELRERLRGKQYSRGDLHRLTELKEALAGWISKGGFPPAAWKVKRGQSQTASHTPAGGEV